MAIHLKEDAFNLDGKAPFCIGMQRNKLLTRKVADELTHVAHGRGVSDSVIEFANEWWNFRYGMQGKGIKILGPSVCRKISNNNLPDDEKIIIRNELSQFDIIILPIQFSYMCEPTESGSAEGHWSLLLFFSKLSLFLHFDSGYENPNECNFTAQNVAKALFDIATPLPNAGGSFSLQTVDCVKQENNSDSGLFTMAVTACLAKYLLIVMDQSKGDELLKLPDKLMRLVNGNITKDYILFLRSFLKRLHSKLHQKLYESVMTRRSFGKESNTESVPQKRKLDTSFEIRLPLLRRKVSDEEDLEEMERNMLNFKIS